MNDESFGKLPGSYLESDNSLHNASMKTLTLFLLLVTIGFAADKAIAVGSKVTFTASADGTQPITFDWFRNDVKVFTGNPFVILKLAPSDVGSYTVKATNDFGSAMSDPNALTIGAPPTKPNVSIESGGIVNLTIKVPKGSKVAVTNN